MATAGSASVKSVGSISSGGGIPNELGLSQSEFNSRISIDAPTQVPTERLYGGPASFGMGTLGRASSVSTVNYADLAGMDKSSNNNEPIQSIERRLYGIFPGKTVTSNRNSDRANAIIISDSGVVITSSMMMNGLSVTNSGVNIQGPVNLSGSGTSIRKGEYTENPKSSNEFTYRETIDVSSIPSDLKTEMLKVIPKEVLDSAPIYTDFSFGPAPHFHTISMHHIHKIDPPYLSKFPRSLDVIKGAKSKLGDFLSESSGFSDIAKLTGSVE